MDNWDILKKELSYYGINLTEKLNCKVCIDGNIKVQTRRKVAKEVEKEIKLYKQILLSLWNEIINLLDNNSNCEFLVDDRMIDLFSFSLKDLAKFLLCFEGMEKSKFAECINNALNRDIVEFTKEQIYRLPDYKISIDWTYRMISRLMYVDDLLFIVSNPKKSSSESTIKIARGISGPWAHLDLPMEERVFPFGDILQERSKEKKHQRRYTKGFENYNNGAVAEGHYWRELRNEPFLWSDRRTESPYPSRDMLTRW